MSADATSVMRSRGAIHLSWRSGNSAASLPCSLPTTAPGPTHPVRSPVSIHPEALRSRRIVPALSLPVALRTEVAARSAAARRLKASRFPATEAVNVERTSSSSNTSRRAARVFNAHATRSSSYFQVGHGDILHLTPAGARGSRFTVQGSRFNARAWRAVEPGSEGHLPQPGSASARSSCAEGRLEPRAGVG